MYILTASAGYIRGQFPEWDWGFLFDEEANRFSASYHEVWDKMEEEKDGTLTDEQLGLVAFRRFLPANYLSNKMAVNRDEDNYWYLLSIHPSEVVSSYLFGIRRDLILYALIVLGTILPIIAALFRNLIQKNDQLNTVLVDLELSNDNLRQSQLELQHKLSQMEELTQEKEGTFS